MTTISSNSSTGIVLTSPSYVNPILNTATIDVSLGIAMTGGGGIGWTVTNQGTIVSADATTSSSTLGVVSAGIDLLSGGNITNVGTGLIGGLAAIYSAGAATVVNSGMISGKITDPGVTYRYGSAFNIPPSLTQGAGIELTAGGSVINQAGGTITGFKGIYATNTGITVVNYGSIGGNTLIGNMGLASGGGVFLLTAGTVTNQTSGIITGYDPIGSAYGPITVVNDGKLLGNMTGGTGIAFGFGGGGTNLSNGTIAGYDAVYGYKAPVTFTNFGTVIGGTSGTHGAGVRLRTGGLVVNEGGKTISGFNGAYGGLDGPMTVLNAGLILATGTTLARGVLLTAGGYVSNAATGTIASTSNGNGVRGQNVAATIVNSGSILSDFAGRSAIALQNGGSVTNAVGGLIQGTLWNAIYGVGGTLVVSNAGRIAGTGTGTFSGGIVLAAGGTVTNLSGGTITAQTGIYTTLAAATVLNAGLIISAGTASARGVAMFDGGYVSNASTGTIAATGNGNAVRVQPRRALSSMPVL